MSIVDSTHTQAREYGLRITTLDLWQMTTERNDKATAFAYEACDGDYNIALTGEEFSLILTERSNMR